MDEFQYWADLAASAKGEDRERARFFSDAFQRQIAPQFASLSSLSIADVTELVEEAHDVLDEIWKQTDFDKSYLETRMKRLLEVIGTYISSAWLVSLLPMLMPFAWVGLSPLFVYLHHISKAAAARTTKFDVQMFHDESWKPIYFAVKRSRSRVTKQCRNCVFALLWVLAFSSSIWWQ